jgi:ribonuclease P protein component
VPSCPAAARADAKSSRSARKGSFIAGFPKRVRLLRSQDFRRVYDHGDRRASSLFAAFCLREPEPIGPRVGITTPRALGKAVARNRIKRRIREAVRSQIGRLSPEWSIVINPRRKALEAPFAELLREMDRLFLQCNTSSRARSEDTKS